MLSDFYRGKHENRLPALAFWHIILEPKGFASSSGGGHVPSSPFSTEGKRTVSDLFRTAAKVKDRVLALPGKLRQRLPFQSREGWFLDGKPAALLGRDFLRKSKTLVIFLMVSLPCSVLGLSFLNERKLCFPFVLGRVELGNKSLHETSYLLGL